VNLQGKVCVVTGAAGGIGKALCARFAREGATVVASDLREAPGIVAADVSKETDVAALVQRVLSQHGRIDLFVSNAGIISGGGPEAVDAEWERSFRINTMSHVWAARHVLPSMLERGEGYLLAVASAAGLLSSIGSAPYAVTKHAAVAFAEWMSITYGERGIRVSCLCPQGVNTPMLAEAARDAGGKAVIASGKVLEPDDVAECVVQGLRSEKFLILPHPEVATFEQHKAADRDRWLGAMRSLQRKVSV
jgi:NAD(P)-dependent dehydrogenase (short-subunit alcohol dehydrogenase family)